VRVGDLRGMTTLTMPDYGFARPPRPKDDGEGALGDGGGTASRGWLRRPPLTVLSRGDLASLPQPEPLIEDTIDRRTVAVVAGHFGTLKSFVLLDWAASVATGSRWLRRSVAQGSVLYVAAEGAYGLNRRLGAWEHAHEIKIPDDQLGFVSKPINLLDAGAVEQLCEVAEGRLLVVIDTLARCMPGAEENSAKDMGIAVDALYRIRDATVDGTVVVAHHTGKDRSTVRGSSALEAGVDTVYTTEGESKLMKMTRTKRKDGPRDDALELALSPVLDSGVIVSAIASDMNNKARELLSIFMSAFKTTGATKAELRRVATDAGFGSSTFHRSLNQLVNARHLVDNGKQGRPHYVLPAED
jgi:hypothetical protein